MGSSQLYSLSWGEFGTSLISAVQLLRCHGDLVDVTLAAGGRSFPAHKIVLSAASPFLLDLLKSTPCQHPVVMLAGVTAHDLEALLEFVYRGEVSVDPNQLPSLLQAAHCLNIQGLAPGTFNTENMCNFHKLEDVHPAMGSHEALSRDVINSFLPIRRKRKTKLRNSTGTVTGSGSSGSKWARHDSLSTDSENQPAEHHQNSSHASHMSESDVLNTSDSRKNEDGESSNQSADETSGPTVQGTGCTKIRGASDQPGACPLCGALLRQARNLRRHLLTSCKYRMSVGPGGVGLSTAYPQQPSALEPEVQLQQPATFTPLLPVALPHPQRPSSPLRPLTLQGLHHQQSQPQQQQQQQQQPPAPQQQQPATVPQQQDDSPVRAVLLHVQHPHQPSQQLLQLPPEERTVQQHLPLPVPLLAPLHHPQQPEQCEQLVCKVSPGPPMSPGPSAPCADLVPTSATECHALANTSPVVHQRQQQ